MKSLKRTLSLVLVLVMVLGLFGVASAAFTDDAKIQYKEAVEVMTGIGAINGYTDGSFNPAGTITRAEAAKMVAYTVLGAETAAGLGGMTSRFTDVGAEYAWAIPSIEYLASKGIVIGPGDGTFNPEGLVTGYEMGKMLLCAIGYGAKNEYIADGWDLNVAIDGGKYGIFDDRVAGASALSAAATREEAALYCFNTLFEGMVEYSNLLGTYTPVGKNLAGQGTQATIANTVYQMEAVATGVLTENQATTTNKYTTVGTKNYNIATGLDLIGHYVKVYYKSEYTNANNPGVTYAVVDQSTVVNVSKAIANATAWKAAFGTGTITNTLATNTNLFTNYNASTGAIAGLTIGSAAPAGTYILNKNDIVSYLAPQSYTVDVVNSYKAPTATATGRIDLTVGADIVIPKIGDTESSTAQTYATYKIYDTPAAKDVVIKQTAGGYTNITKAGMATGTVTTVNTAVGKEAIVAGGVTYGKSDVFNAASPFAAWNSNLIGKNCAIFTGLDGKVVAISVIDGAVDAGLFYATLAYSKNIDTGYGIVPTYWVQGVGMDGKEVNYQVVAAGTTTGKLYKVATAYNSTLKATVATFTEASALSTQSQTTFAKAEANKAVTSTTKLDDGFYYDANTMFIYVTGSGTSLKVATATGGQALAAKTPYVYYATRATAAGNYTVKYVVVGGAAAPTEAESLIFAPADFTETAVTAYTKADGTTGTAYIQTVYIDGVAKQIITEDKQAGSGEDIDAGFYTFAVDTTTGLYTLKAATAGVGNGTVSNVFNNLLTTTGGADVLTDANASDAFIVDVIYDAAVAAGSSAGLNQITNLSDMFGETTNASIAYSYTTNAATGAITVTGIYVVGHPTNP